MMLQHLARPSVWSRIRQRVLLVVTLATFLRGSVVLADTVHGDADGNGTVDSLDLFTIIDAIFTGGGGAATDVNGDGQTTAADVAAEVQLLTEVLPTPVPTPTFTAAATPTETGTPESTATTTRTPTVT